MIRLYIILKYYTYEKDKNNPFADVLGSICDAILYQG